MGEKLTAQAWPDLPGHEQLWRGATHCHCSCLHVTCGLGLTTLAGEKLSESNAADVRELCNTLLSAYLVQLLETGWLHADPHPGWLHTCQRALLQQSRCGTCACAEELGALPACYSLSTRCIYSSVHHEFLSLEPSCVSLNCAGNLLRTPDGKVAILDFGLMQQVSCPE